MSKYIGCWYPNKEAIEENGAVAIAHAFEAANEKQARAKATLLFMEEFPDADDAVFDLLIYTNTGDVPCPAKDWDETFLSEHDWSEELDRPVPKAPAAPVAVELSKLSTSLRNAALVKYGTEEVTKDMLPAALELTQEEAGTFKGHIVEALNRSDDISAMYPERILNAIGWVTSKCAPTAKWPEIKAELVNWKKRLESGRKETGTPTNIVDIARQKAAAEKLRSGSTHTPGSGDPDRFDLVVALLVMGIEPAKAGGRDVKNAKNIIESRDAAWRGWRTTLIGIPDIYTFPESLLYELTLDGMKDLSLIKDSAGRVAYVREHFAGHKLLPDYPLLPANGNDDETEQNTAAPTGPLEPTPPVERTGPFYYRTADGQPGRANKLAKLESVIEQGCIEITKEEYQALKEAPPVQQQTSRDQPGINNLGSGRFSIEELAPEQPQIYVKSASNKVEKTEVVSQVAPDSDAFVLRADELEKELGDSENLSLWKSVMRTNPRYTKDMSDLGFGGTSINAEYMFMRATESFGPAGTGWGWTILEDKMVEGAPLTEKIFEGTKFVGKRILRDADGSLLFELNHYVRIALWYIKDGEKGTVENFGSTPYRQTTKNGIYCDSEVHKKSLTDAIKKCLSILGFSADVWLGLYDDAAYKAESVLEFGIKDAAEKADDSTRIREELDERFKQNVETMGKAVSQNEVSKIASSLTRTVGIHLKSAKEINDQEYAKYLEGRLRRLEEVKSECLAKLQEKAA